MENMTFLQIPQDLLEPRYKGLKPIFLLIAFNDLCHIIKSY